VQYWLTSGNHNGEPAYQSQLEPPLLLYEANIQESNTF
jgi:hypothetical protein